MSDFLTNIKRRAKADKKTIVLPESMDRRTFEAAETILKEDIANIIIIGKFFSKLQRQRTLSSLIFRVKRLVAHQIICHLFLF